MSLEMRVLVVAQFRNLRDSWIDTDSQAEGQRNSALLLRDSEPIWNTKIYKKRYKVT